MALSSSDVERAHSLLAVAPRVVVLTGAGISAESGVPTFRGDEGLWQNHRPEDLASPEAFERDPRLIWEWYGWRREKVAACQPNAAHTALARYALGRDKIDIVTQNVDGLHGVAARSVAGDDDPRPALPIELHGNIFRLRCTRCGDVWPSREAIDAGSEETLPKCPECSALARPHIVWFGESLDREQLSNAFKAAELAAVCLVIGTSGVVQPAASIAAVCAQAGGDVIEVNPEETPISAIAQVSLHTSAVEAVPAILGREPSADSSASV